MISELAKTSRKHGRQLADALLASDLLGRYHVILEAQEAGFVPVAFSEIADEAFKPVEAIRFFKRKEALLKTDFQALAEQYRPQAFTIAYVEQLDLLEGAKGLLTEFVQADRGLEEFGEELNKMFDRAGVTRLRPHHLENVYRTNMQTAYNAGAWEALHDPEIEAFFPLIEYYNPKDERSRHTHKAMGGKRFRRNDPIWDIWWPPNGYQCRCKPIPLSQAEVEALNLKPDVPPQTTRDDEGLEIPVIPDKGFAFNPGQTLGKQKISHDILARAAEAGVTSVRTPEGMIPEGILPLLIRSPRAQKLGRLPDLLPEGLIPEEIIPGKIPARIPVPALGLRFKDFNRISPQLGSSPGGLYEHQITGEKWYIKTPATEDIARNEVLAARLYRLAGVEVPEIIPMEVQGKAGVASRIIEGLVSDKAKLKSGKITGIGEGFAVDAWLANWDVVGLNFDNLLISGSRAIRVDAGGAMRYRVQGGLKGSRWGNTVDELESMRDGKVSPQAAEVFRGIKKGELELGVRRVLATNDDDISRLVGEFGPIDELERAKLLETLLARKKEMAARFPKIGLPREKVKLPKDAGLLISGTEAKMIGEARANGFSISIDKEKIEDHNILFWEEKTKAGGDRTIALFKVREEARDKLDALSSGWKRKKTTFGQKDVRSGFLSAKEGQINIKAPMFEMKEAGVTTRYWQSKEDVPFAFRGRVEITANGAAESAVPKILHKMEALEIPITRATVLDREELYLRQIAWHRREKFAEFEKLAAGLDTQGARVGAMKRWLSKELDIEDIASLPNYRPDGQAQAFMQGRKVAFRPDLKGPEWESFQQNHRLYHRITGKKDLPDVIDSILDGGGMMAPTTDRLRRGIKIGDTMSPGEDLKSGGGSYFFTHIKDIQDAHSSRGLVWRSRLLARLDSISYGRDRYGRVDTAGFITENRKVGPEEWRQAGFISSNETIFKDSLSIFDDFDAIIVRDQSERNAVLEVLKKHKITNWPDGRPIDEVVKIA